MHITDELLKSKNACAHGRKWFNAAFPKGAELQNALDRAVADEHNDYAEWLLDNFGDTVTELRINGDLEVETSLYFAGRIIVSGAIKIKGTLRAGSGIEAGEGIKAGSGIEAGSGIKAGEDFGIFAGLRIP